MKKKSVKKASKKNQAQQPAYRKMEATSERDIALDFATKIHRKFDHLIKATVLFGSQAKNTANAKSDIDIVVIIDDAAINWDLELIAWYREELGKIITASEYHRELHVNTIKLTTWWQDLMYGEPVVINILRYGEPLIDVGGFFLPLKVLLQQGKIKATHEAVYAALQRAPTHLARSKYAIRNAVEGIYWCVIDAAQAALMTAGKLPPSPEHIPPLLTETFVNANMLKSEFVKFANDIYVTYKELSHSASVQVQAVDIQRWQSMAEKFLSEMSRIIDLLLENAKNHAKDKASS